MGDLSLDGDVTWSRGGNIRIDCYPPDWWDGLDTKDLFNIIYDMIGLEIEIKTIQFKY